MPGDVARSPDARVARAQVAAYDDLATRADANPDVVKVQSAGTGSAPRGDEQVRCSILLPLVGRDLYLVLGLTDRRNVGAFADLDAVGRQGCLEPLDDLGLLSARASTARAA